MLHLFKYYKYLIFLQICLVATSVSYAQVDGEVERINRTSILLNDGEYLHFLLDKEPNVIFKKDTLSIVSNASSLSLYKTKVRGMRHLKCSGDSAFDRFVIYDDFISFDNALDTILKEIKYVRGFDTTEWQGWYMPFAIQASVLQEDFDIAYIDSVYQYDDNGDGCINRVVLEIVEVKNGILDANTPYLIRAKSIGEKSILIADPVLEKTVAKTIDMSLGNMRCFFKGNYSIKPTHTMEESCYILNNGLLTKATEEDFLNPFRWFLKVDFTCSSCELLKDVEISEKDDATMHVVGDDIVVNTILDNVTVSLFQADGKMLMHRGAVNKTTTFTIKDIPSGMYIIEVGDKTKYKFFKK